MSTSSHQFIPRLWADAIGKHLVAAIDADICAAAFAVSWAQRVPDDEADVWPDMFLKHQACLFGDLT